MNVFDGRVQDGMSINYNYVTVHDYACTSSGPSHLFSFGRGKCTKQEGVRIPGLINRGVDNTSFDLTLGLTTG